MMGNIKSCFIAHYRNEDNKEQCLWEHLENTAKLTADYATKIGLEKSGEVIGLYMILVRRPNCSINIFVQR
jgi:hypothetical protein